jgi:hypothetical protein
VERIRRSVRFSAAALSLVYTGCSADRITSVPAASSQLVGGAVVSATEWVGATRYLAIGGHLRVSSARASSTRGRIQAPTWTTSDAAVATVDRAGNAVGLSAGSAILRTFSGRSQTDSVLVRVARSGEFSLSVSSSNLLVGQSGQVTVSTGTPVTFSSSNAAVATVSSTGVVTAIAQGSTTINAISVFGFLSQVTLAVSSTSIEPPTTVAQLPLLSMRANVSEVRSLVAQRVVSPASSEAFQAALDTARSGDEIRLRAGSTYTGNFILRKRATPGWVKISTTASMPAPGARIVPGDAALPRLVAQNALLPTLRTEPGASDYYVVGVEIGMPATATNAYSIVSLGSADAAEQNATNVPSRIVFDRVYIHGSSLLDSRRCVALNSAYTAIVDSWISECHSKGFDSQAVGGWNGPGPYLLDNNYLEASGENVVFGGSDPTIANLIPSDIEVTRNHMFKPLTWRGVWLVKNIFEIKSAKRVLVEGNVLENNWPDGQVGFAIVLKSVNQSGGAPWSQAADITFRSNIIKNSHSGVSTAGRPEAHPAIPMERVVFVNNVFTGISSSGRLWESSGVSKLTFENNTGFGGAFGLLLHSSGGTQLVVRNNVIGTSVQNYGSWDFVVGGQATSPGTAALEAFYPREWTFAGNVVVGATASRFPANNLLPSSVSAVGFRSYPENLELSDISPLRGVLAGGFTPGVDFSTLREKTSIAISGR